MNPNFSNATYLWSNGDVGPTTTISTIGDYSLYVTDNSFAHTTMSDTIRIVPPMVIPSILCSADTVCVGDFVELSNLSNEQTNWYTDAAEQILFLLILLLLLLHYHHLPFICHNLFWWDSWRKCSQRKL